MTLLHRKGGAPRTPAGDRNWWHPGVAGTIVRAEFFEAAAPPVGGGAATWYTPTAPFQVTPNSAPYQYYQATLAWSHRYEVNQLDYPRAMERVVLADHGWLNVQGDNDDSGLNMTGFVESWGWVSASFIWAETAFFDPDVTGNYVLIWDQAGGLSSGHYVQLWRNGTLVGYVTTQLNDYGLSNMRLLGDGSTPLPGETQGFWWSNDTAMDPAVMFDTLFDGASGMLDLNADPTIGGVYPDNFYIEPGSGPSGITGTVSGTISLTGSAAGTVRSTGSVTGTIGLTGDAAGTVRSIGTVTGTISLSGSATGSVEVSGSVAGTIGLSGSAAGTVRDIGSVSGTIGLTGSVTGSVRDVGTVSGTIGITGSGLGSVRDVGAVSGTIGISGSGLGSVRVLGTVNGSIGLTGEAFGAGTAAAVSGEISGTIGITGEALGRIRVIGTVEGTISISGIASDQRDTSKQIEVTGFWMEHSVEGFWIMRQVEGSWTEHSVEGFWAMRRVEGSWRQHAVQGVWV